MKRGVDVHALRGDQYEKIAKSELVPAIDLREIARLVSAENQSQTVREYRARLRGKRTKVNPRGR